MRKIKFRGKLTNGGWVYASSSEVNLDIFWRCYEDSQFDIDTIGEFTGICDKNGNEIYEGDIVKACILNGEPKIEIGQIYWAEDSRHCCFIFCPKDIAGGYTFYSCEDFEIIGNIHENPELIK